MLVFRGNEKKKKDLESYGRNLGLAFQIGIRDYFAKNFLKIGRFLIKSYFTLYYISKRKRYVNFNEIMKKKKNREDFSDIEKYLI